MIGTRLSHFRILEKLGEGRMGVVYRAEDERLRRLSPIPQAALEEQKRAERDSKSQCVGEEVSLARGCLLIIRKDPVGARQILEPRAQGSSFVRRHRMLGRAYEALGLWREAAEEYEKELEERSRNAERARRWYERLLADWKDADPDIPELIEARNRLTVLSSPRVPAD